MLSFLHLMIGIITVEFKVEVLLLYVNQNIFFTATQIDQVAQSMLLKWIGLVWFGLCCLMTPGLSKDIRCHL